MRAVILEVDGLPTALGGVMKQNGNNVAFMDMKPEAQSVPFSLWKGSVKALKEIISQSGTPVYARVSDELPTAPAFLKRLGFVPVDEKNEVMIWRR
ncbi:hypothetical protein CUN67_12830 [Pantoea cypripedii]|uniref:GNAT family N-acetyltransferase n=2 Tax=Pantoea cypripedii TaxID=55209 RepID=A0A6B9FYA5_PANCY|nr:hypothetical protein CUN67_12830 [Pantoea cypripedii]